MSQLSLKHLEKSFNEARIIKGIDLDVSEGELHRDRKMRVGWFHLHQIEAMDPTDTPLEIIRRAMPDAPESARRSKLAQFGLGYEKQETTVDSLSGGERARVMLARALAVGAPGLAVDEPLAALDPGHQIDVMQLLAREAQAGGLVIAVLHDLSMAARYCDRVILLDRGRIIADGAPGAVLTADTLRTVYGIEVRIEEHDGRPAIIPLGRIR